MPIYEYACRACEHQFESIQKASEEPLRDCPACGEATLRKLLSAPVFRLKGSGWYETDFKTGDKRNVADAQAEQGKEAGKEKAGDKVDRAEQAGKGEPAKSGAGEANGKGSQAPKAGAANADAKPAKASPSGAGSTGSKRGDGGKGAGAQPKRPS